MTLNGVMTFVLRFFTEFGADHAKVVKGRPIQCLRENVAHRIQFFSDIGLSFMAIFAEVTENKRIIERHLRDIHPLLGMTRLK